MSSTASKSSNKKPTKREIVAAIKALRKQQRAVEQMVATRFPVGTKVGNCEVVGAPSYSINRIFVRIEYPIEAVRDGYPEFGSWDIETML